MDNLFGSATQIKRQSFDKSKVSLSKQLPCPLLSANPSSANYLQLSSWGERGLYLSFYSDGV